jgi:Flp pilus assembly protein TadG
MHLRTQPVRRGAIVPLVALALVGLIGLLALAIDLGLIMIARNQAQNAADAGALAGARTLNGNKSINNNFSAAQSNAQTVATSNTILGQPITAAQVPTSTINIGDYYYNYTNNSFSILPTSLGVATDNWNLCQVTVNYSTSRSAFASIFNINGFNTTAQATGAHRPRDVVIVQDFSGSMQLDSMMGMPKNAAIAQSMLPLASGINPSPGTSAGYPMFGHYSAVSTAKLSALDYPPSGPPTGYYVNDTGELCSPGNIVTDTNDGPKVMDYYFSDTTALGSTTKAFSASPTSYATTPGGDQWMCKTKNTSTAGYAVTVNDIVGSTNWDLLWELDGYAAYAGGVANPALQNKTDYSNAPYNAFTEGPDCWGKSFMVWPPDPRSRAFVVTSTNTTDVGTLQKFLSAILNVPVSSFTAGSNYEGIYKQNTVAGSNYWSSWTLGSTTTSGTLNYYLVNKLGLSPGVTSGATAQQYERILRLFNRAYPGGPSAGAFSADWRARFFFASDGVTPLTDNSKIWNSTTADWLPPRDSSGNDYHRINYNAIMAWMAANASRPTTIFPNQVRSGGIKYYTALPTSISTTTFPPSDPNQRIWKEYIDEVLGIQQDTLAGTNQPVYHIIVDSVNCNFGVGTDYQWGNTALQITAQGSVTGGRYMDYNDNPPRWRAKGWFGPLTFIGFLSNWNQNRFWWSGTCTQAPTFQCKLGVQAALNDIQLNHPNDNVALVFFSTPTYNIGGSNLSSGQFNTARVPLGRNYTLMTNSEWFHPHTISNPTTEFTPYDSYNNDGNFPRASGGTCYAMGLMLAHNQLSSNSALRTYTAPTTTQGIAGGMGRIGAAKLVIMESDGACKDTGSATLVNSGGAYNSYWNILVPDSTNPNSGGTYPINPGVNYGASGTISGTPGNYTVTGASGAPGDGLNVAVQMCNLTSSGGLSSSTKRVVIQCIAFGSLFDPNNTSTRKATCLSLLHNLEVLGGVQPVSGGATPNGLAGYKIILGPWNSAWPSPGRVQLMQQAFQNIMADGFQVTLLATSSTLP